MPEIPRHMSHSTTISDVGRKEKSFARNPKTVTTRMTDFSKLRCAIKVAAIVSRFGTRLWPKISLCLPTGANTLEST